MVNLSDFYSELIVGVIGAIVGAVLAVVLPQYVFKKRVSDKELFKYWRYSVFDRRAFQGSLWKETEHFWGELLEEFHKAIEDTTTCIKTGRCVRGRAGVDEKYNGHGYSTIRNKEWRGHMEEVIKHLDNVDVNLKRLKVNPPGHDDERVLSVDSERDKIIEIMNGIWDTLGIQKMILPTKVRGSYL